MMFEWYMGWAALMGVLGVIAFGLWAKRQEALVTTRKKTLDEAADAVQSLANIANAARELHMAEGSKSGAYHAEVRRYYYSRAAQIVASIPVDRL